MNVVHINPTVITCFFVSWFCIAAFLLLNLVTGAVINNYQVAIQEVEDRKQRKTKAAGADGECGGSVAPGGSDTPLEPGFAMNAERRD